MRVQLIFLLLITTGQLLAQNPELDSLRQRAKANKDIKMFECEVCEAFARYTMIDSARYCLEASRLKKTPSNEIKIKWELIDASLYEVTYDYELALPHYDSALAIVRKFEPPFRITTKVFVKVMKSASFFDDCELGLGLSQEFVAL